MVTYFLGQVGAERRQRRAWDQEVRALRPEVRPAETLSTEQTVTSFPKQRMKRWN